MTKTHANIITVCVSLILVLLLLQTSIMLMEFLFK